MPDLSPSESVRVNLERSMANDAIARAKKAKREQSAIQPVFMGENGKVHRLGQGENSALILPNLYYGAGEEMRSMPVRGGLMAVDNKSKIEIEVPKVLVANVTPPIPTDKRFAIFLEVATSVYMYTGFATTAGSPDIAAGIPYNENGFFIQETYDINTGIFLPTGASLDGNVEIAPGNFISVHFGNTALDKLSLFYPDPYQYFSVSLTCEKNYRLKINARLYQEGIYNYPNSIITETWLAVGDIPNVGTFNLINSQNHDFIPVFGEGSMSLIPDIYSAGSGGATRDCDSPEGITYTFFIRYKEQSKEDWFEL